MTTEAQPIEAKPKRAYTKRTPAPAPLETTVEPSPAPTPEPEIIVHEKRTIMHQYNFTEAEKIANGVEIGRVTVEIVMLEEQAKSVAKDYKGRLDLKEMTRQALATKLTNGYEFREIEALVTFRAKDGKRDFRHPFTMEIIRTEEMTQSDFQMELMAKQDMESKKKKADDAAKKEAADPAPVTTNVGDAMLRAIVEAAGQQKKVELNLDAEAEAGLPALVKCFKKAAEVAEWPKKIAVDLCDIAEAAASTQGTGAALDVLRPFVVTQ